MKMKHSPTEKKILKTAQDTFLRYGFHGTRLQEIALKADVSKSIIHYYFRSKEKLYTLVVNSIIDDFLNSSTYIVTNQVIIEQQKWFLFTELYNNQNLFEKLLKEIYVNDWNEKLNEIREILKI
jgi:AcrR family transcriptional regulator